MASVTFTMLSSGKYSDLKITCHGKEFVVHRAVVCLQSKPLAAAIDGKFKEAITGQIDLDGNEPAVVEAMLKFMYTSDYPDGREDDHGAATKAGALTATETAPEIGGALLFNTKVYIIGEQLDVQPLKELAKNKFEEIIGDQWNSASFVASLKLLYEGTPEKDRLLKDVAIKTAGKRAKQLCDRGDFVTLCKEDGEIAFDVLKAVTKSTPKRTCPDCLRPDCLRSNIMNESTTRNFYCLAPGKMSYGYSV
ncbi:uncharacterized protein L3040_002878 [Drepanopeziza brunnea f. sp. 'multigermtubi']|uniref:BTB/POZ domain protein n=1 Tax=Marssonina brunnea f. sp. multigermtubi (strain MB_m1) TaxID=1072389 RepID=K1XHE1_MARBU|nr:BTB/POZ domain protein [Drepanopeziza brunnea f. sp. 'multigermtubi' MB_m1]EKD20163.1 BTB/POZ domain protein [Drepanopeziza brunnea f. sp. 'multigermtubi' MB_m1]KAJ5051013.1 hypothetical protein L3040_002878 [Drepanopeziza brunnea f. sp. 'multigermtubi']